jgi:hypothetical protein
VISALLLVALLGRPQTPDSLAPSYYQGDGTGVNWYLDLHPNGTFVFRWEGCLGTYDEKKGGWKSSLDGTVELHVEVQKADPTGKSVPLSLRPIHWGNRLYLIDSAGLLDFCNLINSGSEPRKEAHGLAFLRDKDWERPVAGSPDIPAAWRTFLLSAPVRGRIIKALGARTAKIDRGESDGLKAGMELYWQGPDFLTYRVRSTTKSSAVVETLYHDDTKASGPVSSLLYDETLQPKCGQQ